ncbi:MAG: DUF3482 domain-containing protein [Burkholderiales bacterium]|nr:DUF3482 domain-containing protein [Burkholderiales bacterium]
MPAAIELSLISHTNAGKTTLARTLLARDVGDVRDAPHVTTESTAFTLVESAAGDSLTLWDTPGFGDSARLARRLQQEGNPVGWFLTQVWDRYRDRSFWLTQLAVRNVRDHADVVLYLVNAAEDPGDAGYLTPELAVLAWIGKPVLVLLNQMGPPRTAGAEAADIARWRAALAPHPQVRDVLALDAFARCWVQEFALFSAVEAALPPHRRAVFARLGEAWRVRRWAQFDDAMAALAQPLAAAVCARAVVARPAMLRRLGTAIGVGGDSAASDQARAVRGLAQRVDTDLRAAMDRLIAIHDLEGHAAGRIEARLEGDVQHEGPLREGEAAAVGGVLSGALTGLAADLAAGGLTFGAGMLTGAVLGALGGAGVARAINVVRGRTDDSLRWDDAFLSRLVASMLLRYLAVAHYGRGRGDYVESEAPAFWRARVEAAVAARAEAYAAVWAQRGADCEIERVVAALAPLLGDTARALLRDLYPAAFTDDR